MDLSKKSEAAKVSQSTARWYFLLFPLPDCVALLGGLRFLLLVSVLFVIWVWDKLRSFARLLFTRFLASAGAYVSQHLDLHLWISRPQLLSSLLIFSTTAAMTEVSSTRLYLGNLPRNGTLAHLTYSPIP